MKFIPDTNLVLLQIVYTRYDDANSICVLCDKTQLGASTCLQLLLLSKSVQSYFYVCSMTEGRFLFTSSLIAYNILTDLYENKNMRLAKYLYIY